MTIESPQNERIKNLSRLLSDNHFRKKSGTFVVEGWQENARAQKFGYLPTEFFICEEFFTDKIPEGRVNYISAKLYDKIAYRGGVEGIIGIYRSEVKSLSDFQPQENSTVIVVEGAEKPGNIGAILRSCEAFGINAVIITDPKADFFNPNVIRSSVGCLFGMNIFAATNEETGQFLNQKKFSIYTTFMDLNARTISDIQLTGNLAIVFGTEHSGISEFWKNYTENILIPMAGTIDSLNLSNAVAICCYEIMRQRNKIG